MIFRSRNEMVSDPAVVIDTLSREHGAALLGWARKRFTDPRDADEVVSETFVRAWRGYGTYDPARGNERQWLFGIAKNVAIDHHRKAGRHLRVVSDEDHTEPGAPDPAIDRIAELSQVRDALDQLSENHRLVIVEAFFNGRTTQQISDDHGIPPGTVKSRLFYGLKAIRNVLEEEGVLL